MPRSRGTPGAPRIIGQHSPLSAKEVPNNSQPLPGKRPAKNWAGFPPTQWCKCRGLEAPREPREKLGSIPPYSLRRCPITRSHSRENVPRKIGQHFPLRSGVKNQRFPGTPGDAAENPAAFPPKQYVSIATVDAAGGELMAPRAAQPNSYCWLRLASPGGKAATTDQRTILNHQRQP